MSYCYNCFREHNAPGPCPHCGYDPASDTGKFPQALPHGTILAGQFITGRVLGQGGFGITYLALDNRSGDRVALKEFLPDTMAGRFGGSLQVTAYSGDLGQQFQYGLDCFLEEARTLAKFIGSPHIVGVRSCFQENGTAYFTMDYIEGVSLKALLRERGGQIGWEEAARLLLPVMDALETVHRDVTPDNIYISRDGQVKLLDFGAARYSLGDRSRSLDVVLKPGYAPKEQYIRRGRQGPYTDVYSVGACFYAVITGSLPPEALERMEEDELVPPSTRGIKLPPALEDAILKALEVQAGDRYQTMSEFSSAVRAATNRQEREGPPQPEVKTDAPGYFRRQYPYNTMREPPVTIYAGPPVEKPKGAAVQILEQAEKSGSEQDPLPDVKTPGTWLFTPVYIVCLTAVVVILAFMFYKYYELLWGHEGVSGPAEQEAAQEHLIKEIIIAGFSVAAVGCVAMIEMLRQRKRKREPFFRKGLWLYHQGKYEEAYPWFKYSAIMGSADGRRYREECSRLKRGTAAQYAGQGAQPKSSADAPSQGSWRAAAIVAALAVLALLGILLIPQPADESDQRKLPNDRQIFYENGDEYEGDIVDGAPHGSGTMTYVIGNTYTGDWKNGKRDGSGRETYADYISVSYYDGQWADDQKNGAGTMVWKNGDTYKGQWVNGDRCGVGIMTWKNGDIYEGEWADGKFNGVGRYAFADGTVLEGTWKDNELQE